MRIWRDAVLHALDGCPDDRQRRPQIMADGSEQHLTRCGEPVALFVGLLQRVDHAVHGLGGAADFVLAVDAGAGAEVARGHLRGDLTQTGNVASERPSEMRADNQSDARRQRQHDEEQAVVV